MNALRTLLVCLFIAGVVAGATGCSLIPFFGNDDDDAVEQEINTTEQVLYRNANRSLRSGNYEIAIQTLEQLERHFPFGRYADQAQLELVFARYQSADHDTARSAADRFIRLHPQHNNIDYAYYLKGLSAYNKNSGLFDRVFTTDASKRDMTSARQAYADFAQLLNRYPNSQYAADAQQRMVYLRNILAASEINVADYYLRRGAYIAAANRARYVLETYPKSTAVADALIVLVEANYKLDLPVAANDAMRILAINYPSNSAFDDHGDLVLADRIRNRDRSWTNLMTLGMLDRPTVPPPIRLEHPEGFIPPPPPEDTEVVKKKKRKWYSWLPFV